MKAKINTFHPIFDFVPADASPVPAFEEAGFSVIMDSVVWEDSYTDESVLEIDEPEGYSLAGLYEDENGELVACWVKPETSRAVVYLVVGDQMEELTAIVEAAQNGLRPLLQQ